MHPALIVLIITAVLTALSFALLIPVVLWGFGFGIGAATGTGLVVATAYGTHRYASHQRFKERRSARAAANAVNRYRRKDDFTRAA